MSIEPEIFIPEKYLKRKEVLVPFQDYGLGVFIPASKMSAEILSGRIAAQIIVDRMFIAVVHETAVPEDS